MPCTNRVLHTLNIRLFPEQLVYIINHAEDEVIFVDRSLLALLLPLMDQLQTVRHLIVMDDGAGDVPESSHILDYEDLLSDANGVEFSVRDERQAASMCYTSGTTGNPKGVVYSHRSTYLHTLSTMTADVLGIRESDVILPVVPMFHVNSWGLQHAAVAVGATLVNPGPNLQAEPIARLLESEKVTVTAGVPTIWMGVLPELIGRMTETSPLAAIAHVKSSDNDLDEESKADIRSSVGTIVPSVEFRICDPGSTNEMQWDGESSGELQVRGPFVTARYYKRPDATDSFTSDGWLRTGDVATCSESGYISLVDRTKDLIKSGGEWISSVDIENEIMSHPKVAEAAVIAVASKRWMESPMACVVLKKDEVMTHEELLEFLTPRMAKWWLPSLTRFIDEVPKTSTGKFSKRTLRDKFADLVVE